ncbi:mitochondrial mRNA pseudouridine synthase Trub2-like isoform X2 [Portunus trituberculatus]|uniref:mitochondrial mRNA pseudouridine synthase Trub2-like isoform X2 n=1 Tax=Portunus trituberculatus TaxID=210409 RepID=UPI001E1CB67F|nr:mitochondrial mRNA pseudouridine synthase Trub2-like isoform X2 [Portunus trituberculatus]
MAKLINYAPEAWNHLHGVFCVYKPVDMSVRFMRNVIVGNLCRDLNELQPRHVPPIVAIEGSISEGLVVKEKENFAAHELVLGPHYQPKDLRVSWAQYLHKDVSGVCIMGVNRGCKGTHLVRESRLIRTYMVSGKFGYATDNLFHTGKVVEKSRFAHVTKGKIVRALMSIQAAHQRASMEFLGLDIHSQEAYEALSCTGLVRPEENSSPILYALSVKEFNPPDFTLEVSSINETGDYLKELIHSLGIKLKTNAVCTQLRCVRYGPWTLGHALLRKHWSLEHIVNNIGQSYPLLNNITPKSPSLASLEENEHMMATLTFTSEG